MEVLLNGTKYRCVSPRTEKSCPWGGSWEWYNEWFQRWDRVINYNHKIALNKIVESNNQIK